MLDLSLPLGLRDLTPDHSAHLADLSARLEALEALQEKVKTDGRLQPWLAKHGLGEREEKAPQRGGP